MEATEITISVITITVVFLLLVAGIFVAYKTGHTRGAFDGYCEAWKKISGKEYTIDINGKEFAIQKDVFYFIDNMIKERDYYKDLYINEELI